MNENKTLAKALEIIKEEAERAGVRKYTCVNGTGYSQFERNIADRIIYLTLKNIKVTVK